MAPCDVRVADGEVDFLPADFSGEIQHHGDGQSGLLFESLESAACDGFERVIVQYSSPDTRTGQLGLWAEWTGEVRIEGTDEVAPIDGPEVLHISVVGVTWQPGTGAAHSVGGPSGNPIAEVRYYEQSGGSASLYLGLAERAEYRVFTLDDPSRILLDIRATD